LGASIVVTDELLRNNQLPSNLFHGVGLVISFEVVPIKNAKSQLFDGWAVQRTEADGFKIVVTKIFDNVQEAAKEAAALNREASRRSMS
jgi:hypothetical protein